MTDYTQIGNAIKTTLLADSWLGDPLNVKTVEVHTRGFSLQNEQDALFFSPQDLPAITIVPNASPKTQSLKTTNEILEIIPCDTVIVTRNRDLQTGMTSHQTIVGHVERVLEKQKSSALDLGIDAFIASVVTAENQFKKGNQYYFISTTTARIETTATF